MLNGKYQGERSRDVASVLLAVAILIGAFAPQLVNSLEPYAFHALFMLMVFSLNTLSDRPERVLAKLDIVSVKIVIWQLFAVPAAVVVLAFATNMPSEVRTILLISATASTIFAAPALVHIIGLDVALATRTMVLSTLLAPISLFIFGILASALPITMAVGEYVSRTVVFLVVPLIISSVWRRIWEQLSPIKKVTATIASHWGALASLIVFGLGVMAAIHDFATHNLPLVFAYACVAIVFGFVVFGTSVTLFMRAGATRSSTAGFVCALRNVGLSFAILGPSVGVEVALYVAVCQIPIFLMPLFLRIMGNLSLAQKRSGTA